jgi:putative membrane protein
MAAETTRRTAIRSGGCALAWLGLLASAPVAAQDRPVPPFDPARFLAFAASSAEFQRRAAEFASTRDTRPEVRSFAGEIARFRERQLVRLREAVMALGEQPPSSDLRSEHRVVIENLEPLDYLALSRRYMEVQMQALDQEARGYEVAARDGQGAVRILAEESLPEIRRWREEAQRAWAAIAP